MLPQDKLPSNPLNLSPQASANALGAMTPQMANQAEAPQENPAEATLRNVLGQFRGAWAQLEGLNGKYGGDADKFRAMQVAAEDWLATIADAIPASSNQGI